MTAAEELKLIRQIVGKAVEDLRSTDPRRQCVAELNLACASSEEFEPLPNGNWRRRSNCPSCGTDGNCECPELI